MNKKLSSESWRWRRRRMIERSRALAFIRGGHQSSPVPPEVPPALSDEYEDGLAGAPAGSANYPTLLNGFSSGNRPPWHVAGVHYRVGVPEGLSLIAGSTVESVFNPGDVEISGSVVNVNASGLTIDGYDFTDYLVQVLGNNTTIANCKFGKALKTYHTDDVWNLGEKLTVRACTFLGAVGSSGELMFFGNDLTVTHCLFEAAESDHIQLSGGALNNTAMKFVCRYNHFRNAGTGGGHGDVIQTFPNLSAAYAEWTVEFNSTGPQVNTQGFMYEPDDVTPGNGAKLTGVGKIANNTFTGGMNFYVGATLLDAGTAAGGTFAVTDNYYDSASVDAFCRPSQCSPGDGDAATIFSGNRDLTTGALAPSAND